MKKENSIQFPYGAVYFRKSNPPKKDWERDYQRAAEDGLNVFRHWFMWGCIENAPGIFDWEDYDRQFDLAEKYGIKTIIAEMSVNVPLWLVDKYPEMLPKRRDGSRVMPYMGDSSAVGGFSYGLCMDHPIAKELNENFLIKLAEHYKGHPALLGYDISNECHTYPDICYCEHTELKYQNWLKQKYQSLNHLKESWYTYSYTGFAQIKPPIHDGPYAENLDWLQFRKENFYEEFQWRVKVIESIDPDSVISAHGVAATMTPFCTTAASDDLEFAKHVDIYGLTFVASRRGAEPWKHFNAIDIARSAAKEKPFWHAETQCGPLWLQPQVVGRPKEDGRITAPEDIRIWNLTSMACGAKGILCPRYRPLLDGVLFGAFGAYGMDGSRNDRSNMFSSLAKWANSSENKSLFRAKPVKGQVGILYVPESQTASYLHSKAGSEDAYNNMMNGIYRGFYDNNIQPDYIKLSDINDYDFVYLPYPIMLMNEQAKDLMGWVKNGGNLICEACPGYFGDHFHVGESQPNYQLDELFGVKENNVEFMPDILTDISFELEDCKVSGCGFLQTYEVTTSNPLAYYQGKVIAARNSFGAGQTMIIGCYLSGGYHLHQGSGTKELFRRLLENFANKRQLVKSSHKDVKVRIQEDTINNRRYMWILNTSQTDTASARIVMSEPWGVKKVYWGLDNQYEQIDDRQINVLIESKNGLVIEI